MATFNKDFITRNGVQATNFNNVAVTRPASLSTFTLGSGKTLTVSNTLTFTGNDSSSVSFGSGGTVAYTGGTLAQFGATTSSQLAGIISDETGTGSLVFANTPTLVTPVLGVATATSINKVAITAPATSATLTIADSKTLTVSNTLTFAGNDSASVAFGAGGTVAYVGGTLAQFSATTSSQLAGVISDETGSGALVFGTSPTFTTSVIAASATMAIFNTTATTVNAFGAATILNLGAGTGTTTVNNNLTVSGNLTVNGTTTTINSTAITVDDPIFVLGGDTAPASDDNLDRGIEFRWHNGTTAKLGFFGYDDSTGYFTFIPDATDTSSVISGTPGDIQATNFRGALIGNADTATTAAGLSMTNAVATSKSVTITSNATPTTIDTFLVATYTSAEYLIQMKQGTKMTTTKVAIMYDGTDVHVDEYAIIDATAGAANATITATVAAGTLTVSASSSDAATTNVVIKAAVTYIKA